ncbi:hypothetical protein Tco_1217657 [Tanacetum coccineum]
MSFAVTGQNRLEVILELDVRHLHSLLQEFPEMFPSKKGKASSIPTIFSWGGIISPDSFLPSILLLLVIIVAVVIVVAVILVVCLSEGSSIIKLAFVIIAVTFPLILLGNPPMKTSMSFSEFGTIVGHKTGQGGAGMHFGCHYIETSNSWANEFHQDKAYLVRVPVANFTLQSSVQLLWRNIDSVHSNQQMRPTSPFVPLKLKVFAMVAACASRATTNTLSKLLQNNTSHDLSRPSATVMMLCCHSSSSGRHKLHHGAKQTSSDGGLSHGGCSKLMILLGAILSTLQDNTE